MLLANLFNSNLIFVYFYMFVYNFSLILFFWIFFNVIFSNFKTLYSLNEFSFNTFFLFNITILLFSMAGVPPFLGFFSKLFLMLLLVHSSFFILYPIFFITLFLGLYFYMQNIKFIYSTNLKISNNTYVFFERITPLFLYFSIISLFILVFGVFFIDDLLIFFTWIFI